MWNLQPILMLSLSEPAVTGSSRWQRPIFDSNIPGCWRGRWGQSGLLSMDWLAAGPWWEQDLGVSSRGLEEVAGRVVAGRGGN